MYGLSLRVETSTVELAGVPFTLAFTSARTPPPNHEVYPIFQESLSHAAAFQLEGAIFPEPVEGEIAFQVPEDIDDNANGVPDFYEVAQAIHATTRAGQWRSPVGNGTARLIWERAAGQLHGTLKIKLSSTDFGDLPEFSPPFEIIEYHGTYRYQRGDPVNGDVELVRVGKPTATLQGALVLRRDPTNLLAQVAVEVSTWTNSAGVALEVSVGDLERDPDYAMNYFGAFAFLDGDPETAVPDFELFYMGIDDPNDEDADGIPDLTDDLTTPAHSAHLQLVREGGGWKLTVTGDVGAAYTLERAAELPAAAWRMDRQVVLTNGTVVLDIPVTTDAAGFWRARSR